MKQYLIAALNKLTADLDLTSYDETKKWAIENINDLELGEEEDEEDEEENHIKRAEIEQNEERISDYMAKYYEVINKPSIKIYRAVCLDDIKQLDLDDIGIHWSFEKEGAGCYGSGREEKGGEGANEYVLSGTINPKHIDWEYGFTSFMYYGDEQWECALDSDTPVTITHINDEKLKKPIKAITRNN